MKNKIINKLPIITLAVIGILASVVLIALAVFNQLIADDVSYFRYFESGTPWNFLYWHYFEHTGRLLQSILVSIGYVIAGDLSVKVMPIALFVLLAAVTSWAVHKFIPWKKKNFTVSIFTGIALSGASLILMPSTYDSFLWWTSSSIYLASLVTLVFSVCATSLLIEGKLSKMKEYLLLFVMLLGQTLSEITSVVLAGAAALYLIYFLYKKNKEKIRIFSKVFIALSIGFLLTYFSPGSIARRASEDGGSIGFEFSRIFLMSTRHSFELIASLSLWEVSLMAAIGLSISMLIKRLPKKTLKYSVISLLVISFIGIYGSFCINNYVWYNMPYRALTLPSFVLTGILITSFILLGNYVRFRFKNTQKVNVLLVVAISLTALSSIVGLIRTSNQSIEFLAIRNDAYHNREVNIKKQLASSSETVYIESLPVLIKSQATDLLYPGDEQVIWYIGALRGHNNVPHESKVIVTAPPEDYCMFGVNPDQSCAERGDNTKLSKLLKKIDSFMVKYFTSGY